MGPELAPNGLPKLYFSLHFFECRRREGNDLHWTWGGAHITETLKSKIPLKLLTLRILKCSKGFLRPYRFVWASKRPGISSRYQSKVTILADKNTDTTHWFPRHVATFGCRPRRLDRRQMAELSEVAEGRFTTTQKQGAAKYTGQTRPNNDLA